MQQRRLGKTDLELSALGLGCWQFSQGQGMAGKFWSPLADEAMNAIVQACLTTGVDWFDTAEIYGNGRSERALAAALDAAGRPAHVKIATKWWPAWRTAGSVGGTIDDRLRCLGGYPIALHQVHQPWGLSSVEAEMDAMAALVRAGKVRVVGVSNFDEARMRRAHAALERHGLHLASNQVSYSLLDRRIEDSGVMTAARLLGVTIIAYSPLAQGVLSGRFHEDPAAAGGLPRLRRMLGFVRKGGLERARPTVERVQAIARAHGATASQVALAWLLQFHGETVVAIPGASRPAQAEENAAAVGLRLTSRELADLDEASRPFVR